MFDIEKAITDWRRQMLAAGIKSPAPIEELEGHLREDLERQMRLGVDAARAFEIAAGRIGQPVALRKEFSKAGETRLGMWRKLKSLLPGRKEIPIPSTEEFAPIAQEALELATEESRQFCHDFVGTEHVLLGLTKSKSGMVANVMRRLGMDAEMIRVEIERIVGNGPTHEVAGKIPFTPRARRSLQLAAEEARALNQPRIHAEHILLGLMVGDQGVAPIVLKNLGVRTESVREEILREMRTNPGTA
jgi:hypothetical protein